MEWNDTLTEDLRCLFPCILKSWCFPDFVEMLFCRYSIHFVLEAYRFPVKYRGKWQFSNLLQVLKVGLISCGFHGQYWDLVGLLLFLICASLKRKLPICLHYITQMHSAKIYSDYISKYRFQLGVDLLFRIFSVLLSPIKQFLEFLFANFSCKLQ